MAVGWPATTDTWVNRTNAPGSVDTADTSYIIATGSLQGLGYYNDVLAMLTAIQTALPAASATGPGFTAGGRIQGHQGADVASANNLTLGTDGNYFSITGTTQINLIDTTGWQAGSEIGLFFNGVLTVKYNQAPSGNFKALSLQSQVDFTTANQNQLFLVLNKLGFWVEKSRRT